MHVSSPPLAAAVHSATVFDCINCLYHHHSHLSFTQFDHARLPTCPDATAMTSLWNGDVSTAYPCMPAVLYVRRITPATYKSGALFSFLFELRLLQRTQ